MLSLNFIVDKENLEVKMSHAFDASRERLFEAYTSPELIPKWWGPKNLTTIVDKMDVRVGGVWRFIHKQADGVEYAFNGVYKEIDAPSKLVYTFEFEPMAGHILEETIQLEETNGKTIVSATAKFSNIEDLESMIMSGMESGERESQDRLAQLVEKS